MIAVTAFQMMFSLPDLPSTQRQNIRVGLGSANKGHWSPAAIATGFMVTQHIREGVTPTTLPAVRMTESIGCHHHQSLAGYRPDK